MEKKTIRIDPKDNVLVALVGIEKGDLVVENQTFTLQEPVAQKHKFTTVDLKAGEQVIMYGVPVATANHDLPKGSLISTSNIKHFADAPVIKENFSYQWSAPSVDQWKNRSFMGYHRSDGKVGTANHWLIVPLVFCENRNVKIIEEALIKGLGYYKPNQYEQMVRNKVSGSSEKADTLEQKRVFKNIDGIKILNHDGGCGGTQQDSETLLRLLSGYVSHPNVAGATILSLGCQHAQVEWFKKVRNGLYPQNEKPVVFIEQQELKTEEKVVTTAIEQTLVHMEEVNKIERKPASLDKLIVGLECGGSDGFSGISANPVLGETSDTLVTLGGSTILSEFPELNGVEQNIIDRCVDKPTAEKFLSIQDAYAKRAHAVGSGFDMNPSPGNVKDGLITDAIKSAGAAKKGGKAPVSDVLDYTEPVTKPGLNLLCTPGNDVESTTGLAGSGANIILFTTGLGTPTGNPITPVIKVSSNTKVYEEMFDIIDFNTGPVAAGEASLKETSDRLIEKIIAVASGEETKAMKLEQNDFIPWKRGVSL
ncbi:altronate dehydratase family protein [Reichenbachiella carrageenanivorans]|uniref:Altronate dehydratase family protein n=1 Tax=Reichenbachiella carrageenanivorans TaxID=2979869 RepID=A0ABY6D287_9BACT|nr:altronate dehydratase family protein [Reichenbachiella carrageenanivorans]UXX79864.1 altronate dehydratase family protein [Reichenbachiella carrageenanivorans]